MIFLAGRRFFLHSEAWSPLALGENSQAKLRV